MPSGNDPLVDHATGRAARRANQPAPPLATQHGERAVTVAYDEATVAPGYVVALDDEHAGTFRLVAPGSAPAGAGAAIVKDWLANDAVAAGEARLLPDGTLGRWIGAAGSIGAVFDPAKWTPLVSGTELEYAENVAGAQTAALTGPAYEDLAGLAFTIPAGLKRPVALRAGGMALTGSVAGVRARLRITVDGAEVAATQASIIAAAEHHPVGAMQKRLPAGTGGAVKVQLGLFSGGPATATILASPTYPVWLQAVYL